MEKTYTIKRTKDTKIIAKCAEMMSKSDPWLTLGMDYDQCLKALEGSWREIYVLKYGQHTAGFVVIQPHGTFRGYIQLLCVHPDFRNKGLGTKLLEFCEQQISAYSSNIFICVSGFNTGAIKLYDAFGFKIVGKLEHFVKEGFTELLLRKRIERSNV